MIFSTVLVILFILRLRKATNFDVFRFIRSRYDEEVVKVYRKYENLSRKTIKTELDIDFLKKCKIYNIFPKFLRFKLYKKVLCTSKLYRSWQSKLLANELQHKRRTISDVTGKCAEAEQCLKNAVSAMDFLLLRRCVVSRCSSFRDTTVDTHKRKLNNLGIHNDLQPCDPDKVVLNYSSVPLPQRLKHLLAFGLDFGLPSYKLCFYNYFLSFEKFFTRLRMGDCNNVTEFSDRLRALALKYFYNFKPYKIFSAIFTAPDLKLLRNLASNKEVIVCKPDKGRAVVLVDRSRYLLSMNSLISDRTKFVEVSDSVSKYCTRMEDKLMNFLRKLKTLNLLSNETYNQLFVSGSGPGILYGLPKIHKSDFSSRFQFRPIFAAYNLPSFKLGQYLVPVLKSLTTNVFTVDNSRVFVNEIRSVDNADDYFMASFDVENLFTCIPLRETIDIILDNLFENSTTVLGLNRNFFKSLLEHSVLNSFFIFNGKLYKQLEGIGMGLPLGPTFANIFMCFSESRWLEDCPIDFKPFMYKRYVDDTFLLFRNKNHAILFLDYLNSKHPNIRFTMETECNGSLSFLDCFITRSKGRFESSVYRKDSFTGMGTSFFSYTPFIYKINSIKTLICRAYNVCSSYISLHNEFEFLRNFFCGNGFPRSIVDNQIRKFLDRQSESCASVSRSIPTTRDTNLFITLPYFGSQSEKLRTELSSLLEKYFCAINFRILLVNKFKIGSLFNYKDRLPTPLRSSVVYEFCCARCASTYVGSTSRTLGTRIAEHAGRSYRTGSLLGSPPHSNVRLHAESCDVNISDTCFKILGSASDVISLRILESLYIFKHKPPLNDTSSAFPLSIVNS